MGSFIFGTCNNIHIVDLAQTVPMPHRALQAVSDTVAKGGRILFVGTKRQAQDSIADAAKRSAQYYVNSRWLGGTLLRTGKQSQLRSRRGGGCASSTKCSVRVRLQVIRRKSVSPCRERDKLDRSLGGIKDMGGVPDLLFVIDTNKEDIAIKEAQRLNIPVAAIVDTNCDPAGITFVVPGNDDASRAVSLYCDLVAKAAIDGISRAQGEMGIDIGAAEKPVVDQVPSVPAAAILGSSSCPGRAGLPTTSKSCRVFHRQSKSSLTTSAFFIIRRLPNSTKKAAHNVGEEVGLPGARRELDRQGQGIDGRINATLSCPALRSGIHALAAMQGL